MRAPTPDPGGCPIQDHDLAVFPPGALALGSLAPELEVFRPQYPLAPAARRAAEQSAGEHPVAEDRRQLPDSRLDAGVAPGILGAETGLAAAERGPTAVSA
jgi:hypothetical protein